MPTSRISRLDERRTKRQLILVIIGIIATIILTFTVGIPLLVGTSAFLGNMKTKQPITEQGDKTPPLKPTLSPIQTATNKTPITVEGYAEPESTINVYVNDKEVKSILLGSDGAFSFNDINLKEGPNTIYATAVDAAGNESPPSVDLYITYSKSTPKLEITDPSDGQSFPKSQQTITISGKTDPGVNLTINDRFVYVKDDGSFTFSIKLSDGENTIAAIAKDAAGNETKLERKVTYSPS